jgi:hypothetical protein
MLFVTGEEFTATLVGPLLLSAPPLFLSKSTAISLLQLLIKINRNASDEY